MQRMDGVCMNWIFVLQTLPLHSSIFPMDHLNVKVKDRTRIAELLESVLEGKIRNLPIEDEFPGLLESLRKVGTLFCFSSECSVE